MGYEVFFAIFCVKIMVLAIPKHTLWIIINHTDVFVEFLLRYIFVFFRFTDILGWIREVWQFWHEWCTLGLFQFVCQMVRLRWGNKRIVTNRFLVLLGRAKFKATLNMISLANECGQYYVDADLLIWCLSEITQINRKY